MIRYLFFPVVMAATWTATIVGLERGANVTLLLAGVLVAVWITLTVAERLAPFRKDWLPTGDEARTDVVHNVANSAGFEVAKAAIVVAVAPLARHGGPWPSDWPPLAQAGLALLVNEAAQYGLHRWAHESGDSWLWRMHAVHHAPRRVHWLNAGREHPISSVLFLGAGIAPLLALGIGEHALALHAVTTAVLGYFQHVNLDVRLGPLNWILGGAQVHRWHHSTREGPSRSNYGDNLVLCDILLGTYHRPTGGDVGDVGVPGLTMPEGWWAQVTGALRGYSPSETSR